MKRKCKSCPYFFTSIQLLDKLKELEFWLHAAVLQKPTEPVNASIDPDIVREVKKIEAVLRLIYRGKFEANIADSEEGLKKLDALQDKNTEVKKP
jgi:hypothetical protein